MNGPTVGATVLSAALMTWSCGGAVGDVIRPDDPTANDALGVTDLKCGEKPQYAEPLIVDWDTGARTDLEVAMKSGLVVVAYDCKSIKILNGCKLEGDYEFAGVSRKEQVVQMTSSDELAANLPLSAVKLSTEVKAGKSIDLSMVMIGKRSAPLYEASTADLMGACDGATHFVRAANLGAFAMATGTIGKAAVTAEVWGMGGGAKTESEKKAMNRDGSVDSCKTSKPEADQPPSECQSAIRLELMPLTAERSKQAKKGDTKEPKVVLANNPCPPGYKLSEGICTTNADKPHLCAVTDQADCKLQCDKGHALSCQNLGALLYKTEDKAAARAAYKKACDADTAEACDWWGYDRFVVADDADTAAKAEGLKALKHACDLGSGSGCANAGNAIDEARDFPAAGGYYSRGCKLGNGWACYALAQYHFVGVPGMTKDAGLGLKLLARACDANIAEQCDDLASVLFKGKHDVPKNIKLAAKVQDRACKLDPYYYCNDSGKFWKTAGDSGKAAVAWNRGCSETNFDLDSCRELGLVYQKGEGVPKDEAKGKALVEKACNNGADDEKACKVLGIKMKD